jgi:hypothetical protein
MLHAAARERMAHQAIAISTAFAARERKAPAFLLAAAASFDGEFVRAKNSHFVRALCQLASNRFATYRDICASLPALRNDQVDWSIVASRADLLDRPAFEA